MKVVIDTNILISGLFWGGMPKRILDAWGEGKFEAYATFEIMEEYEEIIVRKSHQAGIDPTILLSAITGRFHLVEPVVKFVKILTMICSSPALFQQMQVTLFRGTKNFWQHHRLLHATWSQQAYFGAS